MGHHLVSVVCPGKPQTAPPVAPKEFLTMSEFPPDLSHPDPTRDPGPNPTREPGPTPEPVPLPEPGPPPVPDPTPGPTAPSPPGHGEPPAPLT
ncbi:hypothetical protein ABIE37_003638 [Arthrobacter bambusae]|uniref:Uncharacterized protein n=2 Tax=Arthrobacter bambusae TaxID=1338426 RepID=A0ABV2PAP4_9MICC